MSILMKSTGKYVYKRITQIESKKAYHRAMQDCIDCLSCGIENLDIIKTKINGLYEESNHLYKKSFFNKRTEEIQYHRIAIDQALAIINSVEIRFITGASDDVPRVYNGKGFLYEDESIFR